MGLFGLVGGIGLVWFDWWHCLVWFLFCLIDDIGCLGLIWFGLAGLGWVGFDLVWLG